MSKQIAAMAQKIMKTKDQEIDGILEELYEDGSGDPMVECIPMGAEYIQIIKNYIDMKRRQANKAKNQRKTLRDLHKAYKTTMMENRWLREATIEYSGKMFFETILKRAKATLWRQFKKEKNEETVDDSKVG